MPISISSSMTLETETLSTVMANFLIQMIVLNSFNTVFLDKQKLNVKFN